MGDSPARYEVRITLTENLLASSPAQPAVYEEFIAARKRKDGEDRGDEVETLPAEKQEMTGWSVFHRDETGLFLFDYHLRGFLKAAAQAITSTKGMSAFRHKIDMWLFVQPRRLYIYDGLVPGSFSILQKPDGVLERPVRAMTMQGPRVTVKRSDYVSAGRRVDAQLAVLPLGQKEITEERLRAWLDYGAMQGLGEWRSGSYGRFSYEIIPQ